MTDKEETYSLRQSRVHEKRTIKELNQTGKRLEWLRNKLGLTQKEVYAYFKLLRERGKYSPRDA